MEQKRKIKWWKVVLFGLPGGAFLFLCITTFPMTWHAGSSYYWMARRSVDFFTENATLYYFYLSFQLFTASIAAFLFYGVLRCFRPARQPRMEIGVLRRRWGWAGLCSLAVHLAVPGLLFLYSRLSGEGDSGITNGGSFTTAGELAYVGRLMITWVLSLDGMLLSLIRRKELKKMGESPWPTVN